MPRQRTALVLVLTLLVLCTACSGQGNSGQRSSGHTAASPPTTKRPTALKVEQVAGGLEHGWDVGFLPNGQILLPQRQGNLALIPAPGTGSGVREIAADFSDVLVRGEGGLLGMVVHPDFATSREFTTCQTHTEGGNAVDVRLVTWRLAEDGRSATRARNLLTGLPLSPSGRHSGCRPTVAADGSLLVGTGDTASDPTIPQNRSSLGGKVLRIDLHTGDGLPDNPFAASPNPI